MLVITEMQQLPIRTRRSEKNIPRWETRNTIPDSEPYYRLKTKNMVPYCSNVLFYIKKQFIVKLRKKNQLRKCSTGTRRVYAMKLETIQWHSFSCFSMTWFCGALKIKWGGGEGWMVLWCKISNPSCGKRFSKIGGSYKNILFGVSWQPIFVERKHGIHLEGHEIKNRNQCIIHFTNFSRCHIIWGSCWEK